MSLATHNPTSGPDAHAATGPTPRIRRALLAGSLVLAPTLIAVSQFLAPVVDFTDPADVVAVAAGDPGAWQRYELIAMFGTMLLLPAIIAAAELVRPRRPGLALAAVVVGGSGAVVLGGLFLRTWAMAAAAGVDPAAMAQFWEQSDGLAGFAAVGPFVFMLPLGLLLLALGLWRSRAVPVWVPALLGLAFLTVFLSQVPVSQVAGVVLVVPFLALAQGLLTRDAGEPTIVLPADARPMPAAPS